MLVTAGLLLHYKQKKSSTQICIQQHSVLSNNPLLTGRLLSLVTAMTEGDAL